MAKVSLQFHANRDEVASWIAGWAEEFGLWIATESFTPRYCAQSCKVSELTVRLDGTFVIHRVALNLTMMDLTASSSLDFLRANPDVLTVLLGAWSQEGLRETVLAAMTDDDRSLKVWRAIRARAKAAMLSGSSVVNPVTRAEQRAKEHYYSPGVRESARNGVRLLASAGWNEYRLDD